MQRLIGGPARALCRVSFIHLLSSQTDVVCPHSRLSVSTLLLVTFAQHHQVQVTLRQLAGVYLNKKQPPPVVLTMQLCYLEARR